MNQKLHVVTGAFGYSGKYIATRLVAEGQRVRTLTNSGQRTNPFDGKIEVYPFNFGHPADLVESLRGADVLYNTYWVRFNYSFFKHASAVQNTLILFEAALQAGVKRIVHISITNPSEDSPLEYFSAKAHLEKALRMSGISFAILRPTVLFGKEDILINNIAWTLRHLPIFGLFGNGSYRLQPVYVDDVAALAVATGKLRENVTIDAIGPEVFTFRELVHSVADAIGVRRPVISMPPALAYGVGAVLGRLLGDVMITWPEVIGLMDNLLSSQSKPTGTTRLTEWMQEHKGELGLHYASELARRKNRLKSYEELWHRRGGNNHLDPSGNLV